MYIQIINLCSHNDLLYYLFLLIIFTCPMLRADKYFKYEQGGYVWQQQLNLAYLLDS